MTKKKSVKPVKKKRCDDEKTSKFFQNTVFRREELDLTQTQLALRMGIKQSQISSLENGSFIETPERLEALCRALETTPDYLFGFREKP